MDIREKVRVSPEVEIGDFELRELLAEHFVPGERVATHGRRFADETPEQASVRNAPFLGREMTVAETHVVPSDHGGLRVEYVFEGVEGRHNARAFQDPGEIVHAPGVLTSHDGEIWMVPTGMDGEAVEPPFKAPGPLDRGARFCFSIADEGLGLPGDMAAHPDAASFVASLVDAPLTGEFTFSRNDGDLRLLYAPWQTETLREEAEAAAVAVRAASSQPTP